MKSIILAIVLFATAAYAEDWQGYVLRYDYQGRAWYWVYEDALDKGIDIQGMVCYGAVASM
jgi:hypothetical protein